MTQAGASSDSVLPRGVIVLGVVSLLMDTSSELIHSLLPLFLVGVLGASPALLGLIEGIAEATASFVKLLSGAFSDRIERRKPLLLAGYGLAALSKPLFPLAGSALAVMTARVVDRIGKGIRGAPRDALIADITAPEQLGAAYGLRQSLDTAGAVLGPLLAMALMWLFGGDLRAVLWAAVVPAAVAVALIVRGVHEPRRQRASIRAKPVLHWRELRRLPRAYWLALAFALPLTLARFSEAFLLLAASEQGMSSTMVPAILVAMNLAYALCAYPVGVLSDRIGRHALLAAGIVLLVLADLLLAFAGSSWMIALGAVLWGLHMGATQGLLVTLVADAAPATLRGTAFGLLHLVIGIAALLASLVAGGLWSVAGAKAAFLAGAASAALALLLLVLQGTPVRPAQAS